MKRESWTLKKCCKVAKRFETLTQWANAPGIGGSYQAARKNGWLLVCSKHMRVKRVQWTEPMLISDALKYTTIRDWSKNSPAAQLFASRRRDIYKKCTAHMSTLRQSWNKTTCLAEAKRHKTISLWQKHSQGSYAWARTHSCLSLCTKHMTRYDDAARIKGINEAGKKSSPSYRFVSFEKTDKAGLILVKVQNLDYKDKFAIRPISSLKKGINPWGNKIPDELVAMEINRIGSNSEPPYKFISVIRRPGSAQKWVKIQNTKTLKFATSQFNTLKQGSNPWWTKSSLSKEDLTVRVNDLGKTSPMPYKLISFKKNIRKNYMITIEQLCTKKLLTVGLGTLKKGRNPWDGKGKYTQAQLMKKINSLGQKSLPNYRFVDTFCKNSVRYVKIQNVKTNKYSVKRYDVLITGSNPWNDTHNRYECKEVQPKVNRALKQMGLWVEREVSISKTSRVDFVVTNKDGRKMIIEVKSDKSFWSKNSLLSQKNKYMRDGKKKYGNSYAGTFLVSLKGKINLCLSIDNLEKVLKSKRLI